MTAQPAAHQAGQQQVGQPTARELAGLVQVHADATAFYCAQLHADDPGARAARALLRSRAVPPAAVSGYQLGYAPPGWTTLSEHLRALGHPDERLLAAGVSLPGRAGTLLDRFRNRVMFPVHHPSGRHPIAFLGRLVPEGGGPGRAGRQGPGRAEQAQPKYLNSPHTALYRKGEVLYGLGAAPVQQALAAGARPVLVEGPLDAIAVTWSSADPAGQPARTPGHVGVAPCGTALTAAQVHALHEHAGPLAQRGVGTAFDHDPAGRQAALRAFGLLTAAGAWPTAATLPAGQDPCDLLARHGPGALARALEQAAPLADVVVDAELDRWADQLRWAEGRVGAVRAAASLLAQLPPEHVGRQVHRVATRLGLEHSELTAALLDAVSPDPPQLPSRPAPHRPLTRPAAPPPDQAAPAGHAHPDPAALTRASFPAGIAGLRAPSAGTPGVRAPGPRAPGRSHAAADAQPASLSTTSRRSAPAVAPAPQPATHHR